MNWLYSTAIFLLSLNVYQCIEYAGSECGGIVNFDLLNETNIITTDNSVRSAVDLLPMYLVYECTRSIRIFECLHKYTPFNSNTSESQSCLDVCANVFDHCQDVFQLGYESSPGQIILLFDLLDISGCPQSTDITGIVSNSTVALTGPCVSLATVNDDLAQFPQDETVCPYAMVPVESDSDYPIPTTGCALQCIGILYSDAEHDVGSPVIIVTGLVSFFGMLYAISRQLKKQSKSTSAYARGSHFNIIMFCSGYAIIGLVTSLTELIGGRNVDCDSRSTIGHNSACLFEGYILIMFADWSMSWCAVIVLELYCNIFNVVSTIAITRYRRYYPVICSILPVTAAIIVASVDGIESLTATGVPICYASIEPKWVQYTIFFGPVLCVVLLTLFVAISIAVRTFEVFSKTRLQSTTIEQTTESDQKETESPRSNSGENASAFRSLSSLKKVIKYNSKILTLALTYTGFHLFFFYERVFTDIRRKSLQSSGKKFVECLLTNSLSSVKDGTDACGLHAEYRLSHYVIILILIILGGYGTIPFLTFGFSDLWKQLSRRKDAIKSSLWLNFKLKAPSTPEQASPARQAVELSSVEVINVGFATSGDSR